MYILVPKRGAQYYGMAQSWGMCGKMLKAKYPAQIEIFAPSIRVKRNRVINLRHAFFVDRSHCCCWAKIISTSNLASPFSSLYTGANSLLLLPVGTAEHQVWNAQVLNGNLFDLNGANFFKIECLKLGPECTLWVAEW